MAYSNSSDPLVRAPVLTRDTYDTGFSLNLMRGLLTALLVAAIAWPIANFFNDPRLSVVMLALSACDSSTNPTTGPNNSTGGSTTQVPKGSTPAPRSTLITLDTTGVPAYLETSTEGNVAWYRHHGFEVQREVRPAPAGPPVWTMWREPRA